VPYVLVDSKYCKGCLLCVDICPRKCLETAGETNADGYDYVAFIEGSKCTGCALCRLVCPDAAITVVKDK
jgi:2-oxoglutarate ferredoxin oxidoreductase subunit delta